MYDPEHLTGPEKSCHKAQVREGKCRLCANSRYEGMIGETPILLCSIGLRWPKRGYCKGFVLREDKND